MGIAIYLNRLWQRLPQVKMRRSRLVALGSFSIPRRAWDLRAEMDNDHLELFGEYMRQVDSGRIQMGARLQPKFRPLSALLDVELRLCALGGVSIQVDGEARRSSPQFRDVEQRLDANDDISDVGWARFATELPERYKVLGHLGSGGMGHVFRAFDKELVRDVAIKVAAEQGSQQHEQLLAEARAMSRLRSRYICPVFDIGRVHDNIFISMAYIDGQRLSEWSSAGVSPTQACKVVQKVAEGLAVAHAGGIFHGDVSASNILVDQNDEPVLVDFGLSRYVRQSFVDPSRLAGTASYMSPEQIVEGGGITHASDIYGLGVVLFELLTGRLPFVGRLESVLTQVVLDPPPSPQTHLATLPRSVVTLCERMLAKSPAARPSSAEEVAESLNQCCNDLEGHECNSDLVGKGYSIRRPISRRVAITAAVAAPLSLLLYPGSGLRDRDIDLVDLGTGGSDDAVSETPFGASLVFRHAESNDPVDQGWKPLGNTHWCRPSTDASGWLVDDKFGDELPSGSPAYAYYPNAQRLRQLREQGWRLKSRIAVVQSHGWASYVALFDGKRGFGFCLQREQGHEEVTILLRVNDDTRASSHRRLPFGGGYHDYELVYDSTASTASLLVDGQLVFSGYRGTPWTEFGYCRFGSGDTVNSGASIFANVSLWQDHATSGRPADRPNGGPLVSV